MSRRLNLGDDRKILFGREPAKPLGLVSPVTVVRRLRSRIMLNPVADVNAQMGNGRFR